MSQPDYEHVRWEEPFLDTTAMLRRWGFNHGTHDYFHGRWKDHSPWGIPGPLYVGDDDACGMGPEVAPNNVCLFGHKGEFLYRQPASEYELRQVLEAAYYNPMSAYAMDGDSHWTPATVAAWWESIQPVRQRLRASLDGWAEAQRRLSAQPAEDWSKPEHVAERARLDALRPAWAVCRWLDYLDNGAERYLQRYIAFLSTGRMPPTG